jgi:hypothetical protein
MRHNLLSFGWMPRLEEDSPVAEGRNGRAVTPGSKPAHATRRGSTLVVACLSLMLAACGEVSAPVAEPTSASIPIADWRPNAAETTGQFGALSVVQTPQTARDSAISRTAPSRVSRHRDSNYAIAF